MSTAEAAAVRITRMDPSLRADAAEIAAILDEEYAGHFEAMRRMETALVGIAALQTAGSEAHRDMARAALDGEVGAK